MCASTRWMRTSGCSAVSPCAAYIRTQIMTHLDKRMCWRRSGKGQRQVQDQGQGKGQDRSDTQHLTLMFIMPAVCGWHQLINFNSFTRSLFRSGPITRLQPAHAAHLHSLARTQAPLLCGYELFHHLHNPAPLLHTSTTTQQL